MVIGKKKPRSGVCRGGVGRCWWLKHKGDPLDGNHDGVTRILIPKR